MTKKEEKKILLYGGIAAAAGLAWWWYSSSQSTSGQATTSAAQTAPASTSSSTTTSTIQQTTAPVNTDPTAAGAMVFNIVWVAADNQSGKYNCQFYLNITNNTSIAQTLQQVTGQAFFNAIAAPFASYSTIPSPYTGLLGTVNDNTTVTIPAGETVGKLYVVNVPVTSSTNFYLAQLAYINADPSTPRTAPFKFLGNILVSSDNIPVTLYLNV